MLRLDTTSKGWGLLLGHQRGLSPGHQWGLSHGHGQSCSTTSRSLVAPPPRTPTVHGSSPADTAPCRCTRLVSGSGWRPWGCNLKPREPPPSDSWPRRRRRPSSEKCSATRPARRSVMPNRPARHGPATRHSGLLSECGQVTGTYQRAASRMFQLRLVGIRQRSGLEARRSFARFGGV